MNRHPDHPIRVVLIDDHPGMHEALAVFLEAAPDIQFVGGAEDGLTGLQLVAMHQPDVLVLDVRLPGLGGVAVARRVRAAWPSVAILVWTGHPDVVSYRALMELSVPGYIQKRCDGPQIVAAIRLLAAGHTVYELDPELVASLHELDQLSKQEYEVLRLLAQDHTNADIADILDLTPRTVETYVSRVMRKLGAQSRGGAIAKAYEYGLVLPQAAAVAAGVGPD